MLFRSNESRTKIEDRTRFRRKGVPEVFDYEPRIYVHDSEVSDGFGHLRYNVAYTRTVGAAKFKLARYAVNVWGVDPEDKSQTQIANEGLDIMEAWMKKIGLVMNITELGAKREMLDGMVKSTLIMNGGYKVMDEKDIRAVLQASFRSTFRSE